MMSGLARAGGQITIDLGAVRRNYALLSARVGAGIRVAAAVKANAYGLGVARVAPALRRAGCRDFFVASLDEGIALRALLSDGDIYVLNGPPPATAGEFLRHALRPVLNSLDQIAQWRAETAGGPAGAVALHIDSGMCRLGLGEDELTRLEREPERLTGLTVALVMSHLACADEPEHPLNADQLARFIGALAALPAGVRPPALVSFANSAGLFLGPDYHFDMVRLGAALYGINPCPPKPNPMAEVVRLQGKIVQVRQVDSPMTVGYGATHRVTGQARIATVPVGYADGLIRALSNRASGEIGGRRAPVVGRVSMDAITLDVTAIPPEYAKPGTVVDLIGGGRPLDEVAAEAGTIGYELLTALSARLPRVYVEGTD